MTVSNNFRIFLKRTSFLIFVLELQRDKKSLTRNLRDVPLTFLDYFYNNFSIIYPG